MRGTKMWRWRVCRMERWCMVLLVAVAGVVGEGTWWQSGPGINWDWRLEGTPKVSDGMALFDIDLFDVETSDIQALTSGEVVVICYFSAGTYADYRDDEASFPRSALGLPLEFSGGEWWININDEGIKPVMSSRLDLAVEKGCDGVDPDYMEAFVYGDNVTGWNITSAEQLEYNKWIADQAHARNLSVGLKNDRNQVVELEPWFDWALSTDCFSENGCGDYAPFTAAGKAVLDAEFGLEDLSLCNDTRWDSIDFILKGDELDNRRCSCGFPETDVECESLLLANVPTASMTDSGFGSSTEDGEGGTGSANGGAGDGGTPTWVIIVAIALVVLMAMMTYGAVVWRRRILSRRKAGGVDDFFGDISGGDRRSERRADSGKRADSDRRTDSEGRASFGRRVDQI